MQETQARGATALLTQFAVLDRVTTETELKPGKTRLEDVLGSDLTRLLVGALAGLGGRAAA